MSLETKEIEVNATSQMIKYYENLGYKIPRRKDKWGDITVPRGTKIIIKIEDLPKGSGQEVKVKCDICGEIVPKKYQNYINEHNKSGMDICNECRIKNYSSKIFEKYGVNTIFKLDYIKEKIKATNLERYGTEYYTQSSDMKNKKINTSLKKYGTNYPIQSSSIKEKFTGKNSPRWKGGITSKNKKIRNSLQYKKWRIAVFERDNYTCQVCNKRGGEIQAHHIEGFSDNEKLRFDINNGMTMCKEHHFPNIKGSFHNIYGNFHNTKEQLEEYIKNYNLKN